MLHKALQVANEFNMIEEYQKYGLWRHKIFPSDEYATGR